MLFETTGRNDLSQFWDKYEDNIFIISKELECEKLFIALTVYDMQWHLNVNSEMISDQKKRVQAMLKQIAKYVMLAFEVLFYGQRRKNPKPLGYTPPYRISIQILFLDKI